MDSVDRRRLTMAAESRFDCAVKLLEVRALPHRVVGWAFEDARERVPSQRQVLDLLIELHDSSGEYSADARSLGRRGVGEQCGCARQVDPALMMQSLAGSQASRGTPGSGAGGRRHRVAGVPAGRVPLLSPVLLVVFVTLVINVLKVFDLVFVIAPGSIQEERNMRALQMRQGLIRCRGR
jgi:hypothetical protein